ncbi:MAG: GNAT family N-acetyltransferase [Promethearchaeota archaeon]|jgi:GNAT superfamily N-acetyltransferase
MSIRYLKKSEMDDLLNLYTHLHRKDTPLPEKPDLISIWEEITTNSLLHYFVIDLNNKLVSSCTLAIIPNLTRSGRPYGLIENVVTHADYRRKGFGMAVLQHALNIAWKNKCYKVMLLTGSKDPAIHQFYEKAGFKKGIKTGFIANAPNFDY